jgi:hypothetical protein
LINALISSARTFMELWLAWVHNHHFPVHCFGSSNNSAGWNFSGFAILHPISEPAHPFLRPPKSIMKMSVISIWNWPGLYEKLAVEAPIFTRLLSDYLRGWILIRSSKISDFVWFIHPHFSLTLCLFAYCLLLRVAFVFPVLWQHSVSVYSIRSCVRLFTLRRSSQSFYWLPFFLSVSRSIISWNISF